MGIYRYYYPGHRDGIVAFLEATVAHWWPLQVEYASLAGDVPPAGDDAAWARPGAIQRLAALLDEVSAEMGLFCSDLDALEIGWVLHTRQPGAASDPRLERLAEEMISLLSARTFSDDPQLTALPLGERIARYAGDDGPKVWRYPSAAALGLAGEAARLWALRDTRGVLKDAWAGHDLSWYSLDECRALLEALEALPPLPEGRSMWANGAWVSHQEPHLKPELLPEPAVEYVRAVLRAAVRRSVGVVCYTG